MNFYCIIKCFILVKTETFLRDGKKAPSQSLFLCRDVEEIFTKAIGRSGGVERRRGIRSVHT